MRRVLFVAEKNDVAKGVASILSRGQMHRKEGRSKYNKIYQLQMDILGQPSTLAITSVSGHLMQWEFGPEMKDWQNVPTGSLFDAPVYHVVPDGMKDIARTLREEAAKADTLVIWTDCDREGENIGAEVVKVCMETNRNIDVYRAKFSEITPQAIETATRNLVRLDRKIVDAVDCRTELDLRIGAAFTRLQTLHLRQRFAHVFNTDGTKVVSYGSCQFPTLGFVVERYKAIEQFIQETFWKLVAEHTRSGMKVEFHWDRLRLFDRDVVNILFDDCKEAQTAKIEKVTKKPKSKYRPFPLDTVELEKLAVRKLKMSAKTAMGLAEKLYNKGYISYPRTETNKFPADMNLNQLVNHQVASDAWGAFASEIANVGANPRNGSKSDEAHPPIHPLKFATKTQMDAQEWRLYELVVRHFLASVSWDAKGQETRVEMRIGGETFNATGLLIDDLGYMHVYVYDKWSDKTLPAYVEGESLADFQLRIADGQTQPPQLLNEADLIALMDKFGIGTDATHAEHIEKIKERQYVGVRDDGRFIPGYLGLALVDGYDEMGYAMSKPQLRADLERQLKAICAGQRTKREVLDEQREKYKRIFEQTEVNVNLLSQALARYLNSNPGANRNLAPPPAGGPGGPGGGGPGGGGGGPGFGGGGGRGGGTRGTTTTRGRGRAARPEVAQIGDLDMPSESTIRPKRGRPRGGGTTGARGAGASTASSSAPSGDKPCQCGQPAVQRTVNKEGPNKGKRFWACAKPMGQQDKCNYFEWA